tara:strand:+ start:152 stop:907 length:756 start_codon:yes stop_codon:yes gene_type:complete
MKKQLKLERPVIFLDLETTGVDKAKDRIVEIAIITIKPDGTKDVKTRKINPGIPIPLEASEIHGIYDKDVKDCLTFKDIADSLKDLFYGCDFGGYNSNSFDIPFLQYEFERCRIFDAFKGAKFIDVFNIYRHFNPRDLSTCYAEYCGKKLDAHKAEADAMATFEIMEVMLFEHSDDLENDVEFLHTLSSNGVVKLDISGSIIEDKNGVPVFAFGKHKGAAVKSQKSYCNWIIDKSDFPQNTKSIIRLILNK